MITSPDNPQVRYIARLLRSARFRREERAFVIEGPRMVKETPVEFLRDIYVAESRAAEYDLPGAVTVSDRVFSSVSDTVNPQGILGVAKMPEWRIEDIVGKSNQLLIFLEGLQDPGNLGTILRTAEAAGCTGIIADKNTVDIFNPKVVRSTMGAVYRMPFVYAGDISEALRLAGGTGVKTYAADVKGELNYYDCDYSGPTAFLIGNEGNGLSDAVLSLADERISIPMDGQVESLNAAMAAGILIYEAKRQRML